MATTGLTVARLTRHESRALRDFALEGVTLPRPVRRRLHALGALQYDMTLSAPGWQLLVAHAPRSPWSPPKVQGPALPPRLRPRSRLPLAAIATLGAAAMSVPHSTPPRKR